MSSRPGILWYATRLPELITQMNTSGRESCGCKKKIRDSHSSSWGSATAEFIANYWHPPRQTSISADSSESSSVFLWSCSLSRAPSNCATWSQCFPVPAGTASFAPYPALSSQRLDRLRWTCWCWRIDYNWRSALRGRSLRVSRMPSLPGALALPTTLLPDKKGRRKSHDWTWIRFPRNQLDNFFVPIAAINSN